MLNKEKYFKFCQKESIPIFSQYWWLDTVCGEKNWNVILFEKGGNIWASFPYYIIKKNRDLFITMPILTQTLGPYIKYPENQKYYRKLSWENEILNYFITHMPNFDYFNVNFHYSITNWLPFYWKGFTQTTRYTYIISKNLSIEDLCKNFATDTRKRRRKKAERIGVEVFEGNDIEKFYELNRMTYERKGENIPYSFDFIKKLYESCKKYNSCKMFFAKYKNEIIAANYLIFDKNTVYYLMGGFNPDKKDLGAMDALLFESIKFALQNNKNFDFEGSMIETIERYFRSFGAIQKQYFQITKINSKFIKFKECLRNIFK